MIQSATSRSRMSRFAVAAVIAVVIPVYSSVGVNAATAKSGAKCAKLNAKSGSLTCVRRSGKLVWATAATTTAPTTKAATVTTAAAAKPIKIGLVNQDSGPVPFPDFRAGAEVAIKNINATGGINGTKIEIVSCSTSLTPESSINCANKMIEAGVALAFTGADFTAEASIPVYVEAGIPHLTTVGWGPSLETSKGSHVLSSANAATAAGTMALMQNLKLTKIALAYDAAPAAQNFALKTVPAIAKLMGIEVQTIPIDPGAPDFASIVATAQASGAQAFWGVQSEPGCIALVTAALNANFKGPIIAGSCTAYMTALGDKTVGVYTVLTQMVPDTGGGSSADIAKRLVDFKKLMVDAGQEKVISGNSIATFGAWTELASALKRIKGDVTSKSVEAVLSENVSIPGWFRPDINCGAKPWPDVPAYCSANVSVWQVEKKADGTLGRKVVLDFFDAYKKSTGK